MTSSTKQVFVVGLIIVLAGFFYLWKLSSVPSSLYADETTVAYNAYSILKTGKDEYGQSYPVFFRLFGAYTPSLFVYTLIPFINSLGLNPFATRLPSAIATLACIPIIFFFTKKLNIFRGKLTPLLASLVFALTPWVVFNARIGYEVTLGYILFYVGVFFLWSRLSQNQLSLAGLLFLSASTYTAHTERYLVPLFLLLFFIIFRKNIFIKKNTKQLASIFLVTLITQIPHFVLLGSPAFWVKNTSFAATSLQTGIWDFIRQLTTYYSPHTYFGRSLTDINLQHYIPEISLFYSWQIVPFFIGFYYLLKSASTHSGKLVLLLLVVSPIPGAMSGHFISIQRVLPIIVPIVLIISLGLEKLLMQIPKKYNPLAFFFSFLLLSFSLILLWRSYFVLLPGLWANWWNYGAKEVAQFIVSNKTSKIIIDNSRDQALYSPIIFYLQYPPELFQQQFTNVAANYYKNPPFSSTVSFGNAVTRPINWEADPLVETFLVGDSLAISNDQAKEHFLSFVTSINDSTGKAHFNIYKTNPQKKQQSNANKQQRHYN